ncbi:cysteine synthase family protein [Carboxydochorda subterranea]|uniref:O-acetylserine (thiol)-lyase n=1 Tax=Carboxydichorda subterranea TaxID=3109565 RepID=A0ABZ1C1B8_9FIRM|nr:cysteine synthase family protein [Limnochorda sp. L945t]WRP18896.1 cysteine synthase family protein [Limnochorda sp. L945t]
MPARRPFAGHPWLDLIGGTPLVRLRRVWPEDAPVAVYVKVEGFNPGGSVKDRPALYIVGDAVERGLLQGGRRILDATSGNTGIAYAMIGAALGLGVTVCMPSNASLERQRTLKAYGAEIILTDPLEGTEGARHAARQLAQEEPERYWLADQYSNAANVRAHVETTGPEIWEQTAGTVTHFVAGIGTSGTVMGVGQYLKARNPSIQVIGVEPLETLHGLEGLKRMDASEVPAIFDPLRLDGRMEIPTEEGYRMVHRLAREEGILAGGSGGAAVVAALRVASGLSRGVVVTVLPDSGSRYLSTAIWRDA